MLLVLRVPSDTCMAGPHLHEIALKWIIPAVALRYTNAGMVSDVDRSLSRCFSKSRYRYRPDSLTEFLSLTIHIEVDPKTSLPIPAHADTLWEVEVKTATQVNTAAPVAGQVQVNTVRSAIDAVLEVQFIMKGLLDLRRQDI